MSLLWLKSLNNLVKGFAMSSIEISSGCAGVDLYRLPPSSGRRFENWRTKQKQAKTNACTYLRGKNGCADCTNYTCTIDDRHSGEESLPRNIDFLKDA